MKLMTSLLLSAVLVAQAPPLPPSPLPFPPPMPPIVCDGTETPCNPEQPWMRGNVEKSCARVIMVEQLKKTAPEGAIILPCHCQHRCNPADPHAEKTMNRSWDGRCEARCSPKNCKCPSPCDS